MSVIRAEKATEKNTGVVEVNGATEEILALWLGLSEAIAKNMGENNGKDKEHELIRMSMLMSMTFGLERYMDEALRIARIERDEHRQKS